MLGKLLHDRLNIIEESHVEHAVGFVENDMGGARKIEVAQLEVRNQATWGGNNDVCTLGKGFALLFKSDAIVTAIDSHAVSFGVIGKTLESLVDLLRKFACW